MKQPAEVFTQQPSALLQIFRLLQKNPELKGVSAKTITLIRSHLKLIDEEFRQNPRNHRLFLEILLKMCLGSRGSFEFPSLFSVAPSCVS